MAQVMDFAKQYWEHLMDFVKIECDGHDYTEKLKEYRTNGILIINIPTYGGGTKPWRQVEVNVTRS